jgi:hypothetical protein
MAGAQGMPMTEKADEDGLAPCVACDRCGKWRQLPDDHADVSALPEQWYCELNTDAQYSSCDAAEQEWSNDQREDSAPIQNNNTEEETAAEVENRGLVRRDNSFSSQHKGVSWAKHANKWKVQISHDGKMEHLGLFATEGEAKARYDARRLELCLGPNVGKSSAFRGVSWNKANRKWMAQIRIDGKLKFLGRFEATAHGKVDAALAYDVAAREAGWPERANFEPATAIRSPQDDNIEVNTVSSCSPSLQSDWDSFLVSTDLEAKPSSPAFAQQDGAPMSEAIVTKEPWEVDRVLDCRKAKQGEQHRLASV